MDALYFILQKYPTINSSDEAFRRNYLVTTFA